MRLEAVRKDALKELYNSALRRDFPPDELRPLSNMEYLMDRGVYFCFTCREGGEQAGYAFFSADGGAALLDYFAVDPSRRGQGVGSRFLTALKDAGPDAPYFLIEVESVESAQTSQQREERERRIRFYRHCGCRATGAYSHLFGVEYQIMILPREERIPSDMDVKEALESLYRVMIPPLVGPDPRAYEKVCRCFLRK